MLKNLANQKTVIRLSITVDRKVNNSIVFLYVLLPQYSKGWIMDKLRKHFHPLKKSTTKKGTEAEL